MAQGSRGGLKSLHLLRRQKSPLEPLGGGLWGRLEVILVFSWAILRPRMPMGIERIRMQQ
eukprot:848292-Pyramimonas_sp.AAC.1